MLFSEYMGATIADQHRGLKKRTLCGENDDFWSKFCPARTCKKGVFTISVQSYLLTNGNSPSTKRQNWKHRDKKKGGKWLGYLTESSIVTVSNFLFATI